MQALAQSAAAVVRPTTWREVVMMVPAPRKPMPLMTCAASRVGSPLPYSRNTYSPVSITSAEDMHTIM